MTTTASERRAPLLLFLGIALNLLIFPLNHIVGYVVNHGDYTPFSAAFPQISPLVYDETQFYAPGAEAFARTGRIPGELDVFELRNLPDSYPVLHSVLLGYAARIAGTLDVAWMLSHAIVPTLVWAVLFWNGRRFVGSDPLAMAIAWAVCFIPFAPRNSFLLGHDRFIQPLEITRMPEPALAFLALMLAIWLTARALHRPTALRMCMAGISCGALFYIYYFYWIAFFAGVGSLLMALAIGRALHHVRTIAIVLGAGILTGIPFLLSSFELMRAGYQRDLMGRGGLFTRHLDITGLIVALILLGALWLYCQREIPHGAEGQRYFGLLLLAVSAGGAIGLNFQVVTGFNAEHEHFYHRVLQPVLCYLFLLILFRRMRVRAVVPVAAAIAVLLTTAVVRQVEVGRNTARYQRKSSPDIDVLAWIRSHLPQNIVVGSSDVNVLTLTPAIAGTWNFVPLGSRSMTSTDEILRRYLLLCRITGEEWPDIEHRLKAVLTPDLPGMPVSFGVLVEAQISAGTLHSAREIWEHVNPERDFEGRRLDYLIVKRSLPAGVPSVAGERFDTVYENTEWRVLRVSRR